jgi:hypothetical protein
MNDPTKTVTNALEYYDNNNEKYKNIFKNIKYINFVYGENDTSYNMINMYDKNKDKIFSSRYEVIGIYNNEYNIWVWSWSKPTMKRNNTFTTKKLLNYGIDLDPQYTFLKSELITSRFRISNPIQIDMHISLASYLSKNPIIFKYSISKKKLEDPEKYIDITTIDESEYSETYYLFILDYNK